MCKICATPSEPFGRGVILKKYDIQYFRCPTCGLIETEHPYWLDEAYSTAIGCTDLGLLQRNIRLARATQVLINLLSEPAGKFVDYGGGYGILTRLMRDAGYDFYRQDKHCANLFAADFEYAEGSVDFSLLTAFEVFEHLVDPFTELAKMLQISRTILFTTELVSYEHPPAPGSWWYYAPEGGQHIKLYTTRSLERLAQEFGMRVYSASGLHLITQRKFHPLTFRLAAKAALCVPPSFLGRRTSWLPADYEKATGYQLR
jgi:hypothetical protein